ncbi:hypothetical protein [Halorussus caseinilyticus]|uniref:Uncharacterized protein n=1 Tax=Halorussus caseinilyticus TaxID=3034025 RepID=A0ABD5WHN4_9EURY|nr:hypothetical protein [Halorussus sp. DT72]
MTEKYDNENNRDEDEFETDRYAAVSDGAGEIGVYDTENTAAWLKSDAAVEVGEMA